VDVNIYEAKTHLSRLIEQALKGEEITIARNGKPLVRLTPVAPKRTILGSAQGTMVLPEGWDAPLTDEEFEELFGGE
jgi:prevent-host-death family protein